MGGALFFLYNLFLNNFSFNYYILGGGGLKPKLYARLSNEVKY